MKTKTNKPNLIPSAATVTLPASDYYSLIKLANDLIAERDVQLNGIEIVTDESRITIKHAEAKPYEAEVVQHVAELLSKDARVMDRLVADNQFSYSYGNSWLNSYSWDHNLREFECFEKAWIAAEQRRDENADQG